MPGWWHLSRGNSRGFLTSLTSPVWGTDRRGTDRQATQKKRQKTTEADRNRHGIPLRNGHVGYLHAAIGWPHMISEQDEENSCETSPGLINLLGLSVAFSNLPMGEIKFRRDGAGGICRITSYSQSMAIVTDKKPRCFQPLHTKFHLP